MGTLYSRVGGKEFIAKAVNDFFNKVLMDERISWSFEGVDIPLLNQKLNYFLWMVFDGPNSYNGKSIRAAHAHLTSLTDEHVDIFISHLLNSFAQSGVLEGDLLLIKRIVNSVRDDVLGR